MWFVVLIFIIAVSCRSNALVNIYHDTKSRYSFKAYYDSNPFNQAKRFITTLFKPKTSESQVPMPDVGYRYHVRLLRPRFSSRRHATTRILRYLPDMKWETAEGIVANAFEDGIALIRILNSLSDAEYLAKKLRSADPPLPVEIYDSKKDKIVK
jgi:hypothetical protein